MKKTNLILIFSFVLLVSIFTVGAFRIANAEIYKNNNKVIVEEDVNFGVTSPERTDYVSFETDELNSYAYKSDYVRNGITNNQAHFTATMFPSSTYIVFGIKMERKTIFGQIDTTFSPIGSHNGGNQTVQCVIGTGGSMQLVEFDSCNTPYGSPNDREYQRFLR